MMVFKRGCLAIFWKRTNVLLLVTLLGLLGLLLRWKLYNGESLFGAFVEPVFRRRFNRQSVARNVNEFCLVTYNILVDPKHPGAYLPLPIRENSKFLKGIHSNRHKQMMKEVKWLDADLLNFQEVDMFYWRILVEELGALGYQGVYAQHQPKRNGVATFYRENKFKVKKSEAYYFTDLLDKYCDINKELKINNNRDAQRNIKLTLLDEYQTGKQIVIANTHIMFDNWKFPDTQVLQIALFLRQLQDFLSSYGEDGTIPWVLSGDFNMYPYYPAYEMVTTGKLSKEGLEKLNPFKYKYPQIIKKDVVEKGESLVLKHCKDKLSHPLQDLKSAYRTILGKEPPLTHYQINTNFPQLYGFEVMKGTLDYIFYSSNQLNVNAVLEPVKEEVVKPLTACPNKYFPSDHMSLKACFSRKQ